MRSLHFSDTIFALSITVSERYLANCPTLYILFTYQKARENFKPLFRNYFSERTAKDPLFCKEMKLRLQTLTGQVGEVEVEPQDTILDLKVGVTKMYY